MDSTTKNAHMRQITRFNLLLSFLSSPPPSFSPAILGQDYIRIYTPDSLLSCIIRLIPKFLLHWPPCPFSSFPFPFYFFSFIFFCTLIFFSFFFPFPFPFSFPFTFLPFHFPSLPFFFTLL